MKYETTLFHCQSVNSISLPLSFSPSLPLSPYPFLTLCGWKNRLELSRRKLEKWNETKPNQSKWKWKWAKLISVAESRSLKLHCSSAFLCVSRPKPKTKTITQKNIFALVTLPQIICISFCLSVSLYFFLLVVPHLFHFRFRCGIKQKWKWCSENLQQASSWFSH